MEILAVVVALGLLSAWVSPNLSQMLNNRKDVSMEAEFQNVQTAVTEMLRDSPSGAIEPVGPTTDIGRVRTCDTPPLCLADYFLPVETGSNELCYHYSFAADGTINQTVP